MKKDLIEKKKNEVLSNANSEFENILSPTEQELKKLKKINVKLMEQIKDSRKKENETIIDLKKQNMQLQKANRKQEAVITSLQEKDRKNNQVIKRNCEEIAALKKVPKLRKSQKKV